MSNANVAFVGSIPEKYDRYLGTFYFEPYAADLVDRLTLKENAAVLEVACGTGIVTRQLRNRLPASGRLVATDLNPDMLAFARKKFSTGETIEWQQADAQNLPFADDSFDAVVCQFGVMFFPDKELAFKEALRVLRPGGVYLFNVWDAMEENEATGIAVNKIASFFEQDPPTFYQTPFGFHDAEVIQAMLQKAGFRDVKVSRVTLVSRSNSASDAAKGLVEGTPMLVALRERGVTDPSAITAAVADALRSVYGEGKIESSMQALVCQASK